MGRPRPVLAPALFAGARTGLSPRDMRGCKAGPGVRGQSPRGLSKVHLGSAKVFCFGFRNEWFLRRKNMSNDPGVPRNDDCFGGPLPAECLGNITELPDPLIGAEQRKQILRLERWHLQDVARELRPKSRMAFCRRRRHRRSTGVDIIQTTEGATTYKGLMICGLVWECPLCVVLITQRKRGDLLRSLACCKEQGGCVLHLILTIPHHASDNLRELLKGVSEARQRMMDRPSWERLKKQFGFWGYVRSLEVTYGQNGWHPHTHNLLFVDGSVERLASISTVLEMTNAWATEAIKRN